MPDLKKIFETKSVLPPKKINRGVFWRMLEIDKCGDAAPNIWEREKHSQFCLKVVEDVLERRADAQNQVQEVEPGGEEAVPKAIHTTGQH